MFSEKLLKNCEYTRKTSISEFDAFFLKLKDYIAEIKGSAQKERALESALIADMQKGNNDVLAIDMEITVSDTDCYNCIVRGGQEAKSNPEMDLLLIVKRESAYYLLPVEIKRGDGKTINEGPAEIASSINILSDDEIRQDIANTYTENLRRYKEIELCNSLFAEGMETLDYNHDWCSGAIVIINLNEKTPRISDVIFNDRFIYRDKCPNLTD